MPIPLNVDRFVAQVDVGQALQDYAPFSDCIRLVGVSGQSFDHREFNSDPGCATYFIDLAIADFAQRTLPSPPPTDLHALLDAFKQDRFDLWLSISFAISRAATRSYAYETFTGEAPTYLDIQSIALVSGPTVSPPTISSLPAPPGAPSASQWELTAFHVGQGMCSLLQEVGGAVGYLLDAGAGTPVIRSEYQSGVHSTGLPFKNELMTPRRVTGLTSLWAILSHPDSDHWRLLDWDTSLLNAVMGVFLPSGAPTLAFSSPRVKPKVSGSGSVHHAFNAGNSLAVHRSQPVKSDRNGECLVSVVRCDWETALLSGDYVYDRMVVDAEPAISAAASGTLDGVVVPHHGDSASAKSLPSPASPGVSPAFFSAGIHAGYAHPTAVSLTAHKNANFDVVNQHTNDIEEYPLIP